MGPPFIDPRWFEHVMREATKAAGQQQPPAPKRPFESGRTLPRSESLEQAVKRINKLEGGSR